MSPSTEMPNLIIPVETKSRELDAKLLFSCFAVARGHTVYLGRHQDIYELLKTIPKSIMVEHSVGKSSEEVYANLYERGHRTVAWDEEALVSYSGEFYRARRVSRTALENVETYLAWGDHQAAWLSEGFPDLAEKVVATGNPRIDLLRPEFAAFFAAEADGYRARFGNYILVNSSFSRANIHHGDPEAFIRGVVDVLGLSAEWERFYRDALEFSSRLLEHFKRMVRDLAAAFPGTQLILRPHPSERFETWHEALTGCSNAHVVFEGNASAWSYGAAAVVHSGCTTGLEAALLGKPVIAYRPITSNAYEVHLPNAVSRSAASNEAVIDCVRDVLSGSNPNGRPIEDLVPLVGDQLNGLTGPFASERILDVIGPIRPVPETLRGRAVKRKNRLKLHLKRALLGELTFGAYSQQKFPGLERHEVESKLSVLSGLGPGFPKMRIRQPLNHCFQIDSVR